MRRTILLPVAIALALSVTHPAAAQSPGSQRADVVRQELGASVQRGNAFLRGAWLTVRRIRSQS